MLHVVQEKAKHPADAHASSPLSLLITVGQGAAGAGGGGHERLCDGGQLCVRWVARVRVRVRVRHERLCDGGQLCVRWVAPKSVHALPPEHPTRCSEQPTSTHGFKCCGGVQAADSLHSAQPHQRVGGLGGTRVQRGKLAANALRCCTAGTTPLLMFLLVLLAMFDFKSISIAHVMRLKQQRFRGTEREQC